MHIPFSFEFQIESTDDQPYHTQCAYLLIAADPHQAKLVKQLQHYFSTQVQIDQATIESKFGFLDYQAVPGTAFAVSSYDVAPQDISRVLLAWHRKLADQGFVVAKPVRLSASELTTFLAKQTPQEKNFIESLSQSPDDQPEAKAIAQSLVASSSSGSSTSLGIKVKAQPKSKPKSKLMS